MITKKDRKLAKQLRRLRKKNKLTQEKVAEQLKVTPKYIQYLESSRRVPSLKLLYRIADLFEVKMKDLFPF